MAKLYYGMQDWKEEKIKLKFGDYIDREKLPVVPKTFGHVGTASPPVIGGWQMLGNNQAGDCVMAGGIHEIMVWNWAVKRPIPQFNTKLALQQYYELSGGKDTGLDPIDAANWRRKTGIADAAGKRHQIKSFASVSSMEDIELAVYLFGVCGIGLELPDNAEDMFTSEDPWDDLSKPPNPKNGHYVPVVGKNSAGRLIVVTWGRLHAMSEEFLNEYMAGGVCYFSKEYLAATGKTPELFNEDQLDADLAQIGTNVQTA